MSYDVDILRPPAPKDAAAAWADIERAASEGGEPPALFRALHDRLTARFPCLSTLADDQVDGPDCVWASGPLWDNFGARVARLAIQFPKVDVALPFVIETATDLGLVVFDWQSRRIHRGDGLVGLTLTFEGDAPIYAPTPSEIEDAVDRLDPSADIGFLILDGRGGDYAQVAGGAGAFVVEWRAYDDAGFTHWAAGEPGRPSDETVKVEGNGAVHTVPANERLAASDANAILRAFALDGLRPMFYAWRDMTADFLPKPQESRPWWKFWG